MDALLASATFEVPKALIEGEAQRLGEATRRDLAGRGMPASEAPLPIELFRERAERQVRLGLLAGEVVRANGLQPKPDQIRKLVEEMSQSYERPQDVINWYLSDRKRLAELEGVALEDNVANWILSNARVTDEPVAFDDLMGHTRR
jgi:trigger factor